MFVFSAAMWFDTDLPLTYKFGVEAARSGFTAAFSSNAMGCGDSSSGGSSSSSSSSSSEGAVSSSSDTSYSDDSQMEAVVL